MENEFNDNNAIVSPNNVFVKTYAWMFMGLFITGIVSWFTYSSGLFVDILLNDFFGILLILELVVVIAFSFLLKKCSPTVAAVLFFAYAILNGVTFSVIFAVYELTSISILFFAASGLFGVMAAYGYKTNVDLSKFRTLIFATLTIGIIVSVINLFIGNSMIDIIVSWVMLILFSGITAYDMQKIKNLSMSNFDKSKLHIYGALELYLDFINIFLRLLSLFGKRK